MSILFVEQRATAIAAAFTALVFAFTPAAKGNPPDKPVQQSLNDILRLQNYQRRDMKLYFWKGRPLVGVMSFRTAYIQGLTLNRIAAFAEKKGTRGRILTDEQLRAYMRKTGSDTANFYAAHDYRGSQLARFFNLAKSGRVALNDQEYQLRTMLVRNGIILHARAKYKLGGKRVVRRYKSGGKVLISLPADFREGTRGLLLRHEARHALFFTEDRYRRICRNFWRRALSTPDRRFFRRVFAFMDYDPADEYLMINEFQSYVLQTTQPFAGYLRYRARRPGGAFMAQWLRKNPGRLTKLRKRLGSKLTGFPLR